MYGWKKESYMIISAKNYTLFDVKQYLREFKLDSKFSNYMVDIETTGTRPDLNHIVEVAIVPFELIHTNVVISPEEYHLKFKLNSDQKHRQYDPSTMTWWGKQNKQIADKVFSQFFNPEINNAQVLTQLAIFISHTTNGKARFWSKPNSFDYMFLQSLFKDFQIVFPFSYWNALDLSGFCSGLAYLQQNTLDSKIYEPETRSLAHDSMGDCYFQLDWISNALADKLNSKFKTPNLPF